MTARGAAVLCAVLLLGCGLPATAVPPEEGPRTWRVGPGRSLATPSAAASVARDGDTVLIEAGTYVGDVATWTQDDLTLRGVGGRAHLRAGGESAQGKAIWVIAGDRATVDRLEFSGASVADGNGAGIRQEGTGLTVTRSWFHHNQDGLLTGADPESDIVIRRSRFFRNGAGDGYTHNLYVGAVRSLRVSGSYLWGAAVGHELKSRAARTTITGNRISDAGATASYSIDLPDGGRSLIAGNVVIQGPSSENSTLVSYGAEGFDHDSRDLWVVNNTFVNRRPAGTFVALAGSSRAHLRNNLLVGPGDLTNLAGIPARANRRVGWRTFVDPAADDFRLRRTSPAVDRGASVPKRWRARWEYVHPTRQVRRPVAGRVDLGAFERR
ncbi:right-handed parallel beta-helix repeat-containing protein [Nocardioides sp. YIM 152315]|uniref:right-handed parallel beta-helix repeat-containing protein n=1 Tax=Nocardioides sp. YIM 152315 TaxID=3031760 RepID=UPI0023DA0D39|nr:right-handed parallel beta-helix repeat-containing protein [Nocardioides sp. YIM 152315]MDF1606062.1 right-handed parallel beta-helix repeat-containing protein [Nocardioides sp. YIM 152315]